MDKSREISSQRVFIIGAGFSHHLSGKRFPLGKDLSKIVRELKITELERHYQECNLESPHLEEILTRLDLDHHIHKDRKVEIQKQIFLKVQECLTVKSLDGIALDDSMKLIKSLFSDNDVIITTNYDLLLDHLLDISGLWSPFGNGYGHSVEAGDMLLDTDKINQTRKNIRLLKVHGSFNFFQQILVSGGISELVSVLVNEKHPDYFDRDDLFQSAKHDHNDVGRKADNLIACVLPTYIKPFAQNRTTLKMWHEAGEAMKNVSVVTIIGYSFPEPDQMMSFLMSYPDADKFFRDNQKLKINILNNNYEILRIKNHLKRCLRANFNKHISWGELVLYGDKPEEAYKNLIAELGPSPSSPRFTKNPV